MRACGPQRSLCSRWSGTIRVTNIVPQTPTNLQGWPIEDGLLRGKAIDLSWDNVAHEARFEIFFSQVTNTLPQVGYLHAIQDITSARHGDFQNSLPLNSTWDYSVRACNEVGCSAWSPRIRVANSPPPKPIP